MTKNFSVKSPAKINIGLRILSKRNDGYHNIETIFYPVKIYDEIKVKIEKTAGAESNQSIKVKSGSRNLDNSKNICFKAVELFFNKFKVKGNYKIGIGIKKKIPVGAGLGGGSSDAASALKILCKYFRKSLTDIKIKKIALKLGSDVPFFLSSKPAYAESRGEKLTPLPGFKILYKILIVNPGIHVSTKEAYNQLQITNYKLQIKKSLNKFKIFKLTDKDKYINDFENVVFKKYPEIGKIKNKMNESGAVFSLMSGSGSTVYGFYNSKKIKAAEKFFRSLKYKVFVS